jgi:hypothetical protein
VSAKTNLIVDSLILIAFLVAFEPALTGIAIHEWLSLAFSAALILHILLHWKWVVQVTLNFFRLLFHSSRFNYLVNAALFIAFVLVMLSGVLISESILPSLGIRLNGSPTWRFLHSSSADAVVFLVGLHFALHWKWIVNTIKRYVVKPIRRRPLPLTLQPVPLPVQQDEL